uniref:Uncharacterized protein n=1 Tax=Cacopsylla melanoneura TaxID=428564 RepID=A0A8D8TJB6_9HEMI
MGLSVWLDNSGETFEQLHHLGGETGHEVRLVRGAIVDAAAIVSHRNLSKLLKVFDIECQSQHRVVLKSRKWLWNVACSSDGLRLKLRRRARTLCRTNLGCIFGLALTPRICLRKHRCVLSGNFSENQVEKCVNLIPPTQVPNACKKKILIHF